MSSVKSVSFSGLIIYKIKCSRCHCKSTSGFEVKYEKHPYGEQLLVENVPFLWALWGIIIAPQCQAEGVMVLLSSHTSLLS